jgi:hypothetical protein
MPQGMNHRRSPPHCWCSPAVSTLRAPRNTDSSTFHVVQMETNPSRRHRALQTQPEGQSMSVIQLAGLPDAVLGQVIANLRNPADLRALHATCKAMRRLTFLHTGHHALLINMGVPDPADCMQAISALSARPAADSVQLSLRALSSSRSRSCQQKLQPQASREQFARALSALLAKLGSCPSVKGVHFKVRTLSAAFAQALVRHCHCGS